MRCAPLSSSSPTYAGRRVTAPLIVEIEQSGILGKGDLDQLADGFLWRTHSHGPVPEQWAPEGTVRARRGSDKPGRTAVVIDRMIPPPLRRWAAVRTIGRQPRRVGDVLERIGRRTPALQAAEPQPLSL